MVAARRVLLPCMLLITMALSAPLATAQSFGPADAQNAEYWHSKKGQTTIARGSVTSGSCDVATWLHLYPPFQDLTPTATCDQVEFYVSQVIAAVALPGSSMNRLLKAQTLVTALNVFFSDPTLGGNKIGAPTPIGGVGIALVAPASLCSGVLSSICPYLDATKAFGVVAPVTAQTVSYLLAYAGSQSTIGGTVWYANSASLQQHASVVFTAINNEVALIGQAPASAAGPTIGLPVYSPRAIISGTQTSLTVSSFIASGVGQAVAAGSVSLVEVDASGNLMATLGALNDGGMNGDVQAGDQIFTGQFTFNPTVPGTIFLQVSALFGGAFHPMRSGSMALEVLPPGVPVGPARPSTNQPVTDANGNLMACDQLVAFFAPGTSVTSIVTLVSSIGGHIIGFSPRRQAHAWEIGIPCNGLQGVQNAVSALLANRITVAAEPNIVLQATGVKPNDPVFSKVQAGLLLAMHADAAWAISTGLRADLGPPPLIAVVDSGIDYTHEDLATKSWSAPQAYTVSANGTTITCPAGSHGFNWINDTCDPLDDNGHGTFVAAIAAADSNNGVGMTGISWASPVLAEKAADVNGFLNVFNSSDAIAEAVARGAKVINCSFGGSDSTTLSSQIDLANQAGALVVAAAGNNGNSQMQFPAGYSSVLSVGAADPSTGAIASFSNFGSWVDIYAPGEAVASAVAHGCNPSENFCQLTGVNGLLPPGYFGGSGTSFSTPFVSGTAALVWAANPTLSNTSVKNIIIAAADASPQHDPAGNPINTLDILNAVLQAAAQTCIACPDPPEVTVSGNQIAMGVAGRASTDLQAMSVHGISIHPSPIGTSYATAAVPDSYAVEFNQTFNTWDSYVCCGPRSTTGKGFYDSLSFSSSQYPYWQEQLQDPIIGTAPSFCASSVPSTLPCTLFLSVFVGGTTQGTLQTFNGAAAGIEFAGTGSGDAAGFFRNGGFLPFLNIVLDTSTPPDADLMLPSWATIQILDITPICSSSGTLETPTGTCTR